MGHEQIDSPGRKVTQAQAGQSRPNLVIFDDKAQLLAMFTKKFEALGYNVIPVYVADSDYEWVANDCLMKRGMPETPGDWLTQDSQPTPERTLDSELADARMRAQAGNRRYESYVRVYEAMQGFHYAVTSKAQAQQVLETLEKQGMKPDCILSDFEMRRKGDVTPGTEFMGDDAMALAKTMYPNAPRAIHTSLLSFLDAQDFHQFLNNPESGAYNTEMYGEQLKAAAEGGYMISGKDITDGQMERATAIDRYFKMALSTGTAPRITMEREATAHR